MAGANYPPVFADQIKHPAQLADKIKHPPVGGATHPASSSQGAQR